MRENGEKQQCEMYRNSQMMIGWDEEVCQRSDKVVLEDHPRTRIPEERARRERTWVLALSTQGRAGPMPQKPGCAEAVRIKNKFQIEAG